MIFGLRPFTGPRWNGDARFPMQNIGQFPARIGPAPRPSFPTEWERDEWERGVRVFTDRRELLDRIFSPAWKGYHAALADASARTQGVAS